MFVKKFFRNYCSIFLAVFLCAVLGYAGYTFSDDIYEDNGVDFSNGWNLWVLDDVELDDVKDGNISKRIIEAKKEKPVIYSMENNRGFKKGKLCHIEKRLPDNLDGIDSLFFTTQSIDIKVYVDDAEIYSFGFDRGLLDSSPGDMVNTVRLPENSAGKIVSMDLYFAETGPSLMIRRINIVNDKEMIIAYVRSKSVSVLVCLALILLSIICIAFDLTLFAKVYGNHCMCYIGVFIFFLGIWSMTQIKIMPILLGRKIYHTATAYISLGLLPLPFALFAKNRYKIKNNVMSNLVISVLTIILVVTVSGDVIGVYVFCQNVVLTQLALVIVTFYFAIVTIKYAKNVNIASLRNLMTFAIFFIGSTGVMDIYNYNTNQIDDYAFFSRIGIFVFVVCVCIDVVINSNYFVKLGHESRDNYIMALTDGLTGMKNRKAYNLRIAEIESMKRENLQFGIIAMDINNLKKMNDIYGHHMGDTLLVESGRAIERSCVGYGESYRYGGDEFFVIVMQDPAFIIEKIIHNFEKLLKEVNERIQWELPISVAYGSSVFHSEDKDIQTVIERADKRMYENKSRQKMAMGQADANMEKAIMDERKRIAQEMHDTTGHTLTKIKSLINIIDNEKNSLSNEEKQKQLLKIRELAENGIREMRESINNIRTDTEIYTSIKVRLNNMIKDINEIQVEVSTLGDERREHSRYGDIICDSVREAITNCLRYSEATHLDIIVKFFEDILELYVFDDGKGCENIVEGNGLRGIRERIESCGGLVRFTSIPGDGFQIVAKILI